jgi:flagellin-like hook-associated protein FlgL
MSLRIGEFVNPAMSVLSLNKATGQTQKALSRLSSGSRIVETSDDAAGAAVALKMEAAIHRCDATDKNLQNADSFLRVQASALDSLAKGVTRLMELKTLSLDSTKNASDIANYSAEFAELRQSLIDTTNMKFNGIDLFSHTGVDTHLNLVSDENGRQQVTLTQYALGVNATDWLSDASSFSAVLGDFTWPAAKQDAERRGGHLATVTSAEKWNQIVAQLGNDASKCFWLGGFQEEGAEEPAGGWTWVTGEPFEYTNWSPANQPGNEDSINQKYLEVSWGGQGRWPADPVGTWNDTAFNGGFNVRNQILPNATVGYILEKPSKHLATVQRGVLDTTLQYISNCLANNGAEATAVGVSSDNIRNKSVNLESAKGKITDTDIARETQNLSKAQVLSQISAAMVKQSTEAQETILKLIEQRLAGP